jgi:IS5 family transposase
MEKGLDRMLFDQFSAKLEAEGIYAKSGSIIDATIVEVPKQRNSREENAQIKSGKVPVDWDEDKSCHKDTDARWLKKNGVSFFGYKDHIKTDAGTSLITDYRVTPASTHDSVVLKELVSEADGGKPLHADSAYTGEEIEKILKDLKIENKTCEKGRRGAPLTEPKFRKNLKKMPRNVKFEPAVFCKLFIINASIFFCSFVVPNYLTFFLTRAFSFVICCAYVF